MSSYQLTAQHSNPRSTNPLSWKIFAQRLYSEIALVLGRSF